MPFKPVILLLAVVLSGSIALAQGNVQAQEEIRIIVRGDDLGMTQGSLVAFERAFNHGIMTCGGIQACSPWVEAACELAVRNPQWCIGVHLTLVGEWRGYRWRPVLPWDKVSTIVDEDGYFYTDPIELFSHKPKLSEIEAELRAQIELVKKRGVKISYLDSHYTGYTQYPGLEDVYLRLARDYDLPISGRMGEKRGIGNYKTPPAEKTITIVRQLEKLEPGLYLWNCHPGIDSPEQNALIHTRPEDIFVFDGVGKHRAAELETLTSTEVRSMILQKRIRLVNYAELYKEIKK
jgi:predicted glycoside hydrolase/deacetylase ChbG (UPF0249 family)